MGIGLAIPTYAVVTRDFVGGDWVGVLFEILE